MSGVPWCARWPRRVTGYVWRSAVPTLPGFLQPLGAVGQIQAVQANLRYPASVKAAVAGSDVVINCVGILAEGGNQRFMAVQAQGAKHVAEAAREASARLIHISAIGADADSASAYARSKAQGEAAVRAAVPDAIILRPSIIFGQDDSFFNRFAGLSTIAPCPAPHRGRRNPVPAGLCRRCRGCGDGGGGWLRQTRHDL